MKKMLLFLLPAALLCLANNSNAQTKATADTAATAKAKKDSVAKSDSITLAKADSIKKVKAAKDPAAKAAAAKKATDSIAKVRKAHIDSILSGSGSDVIARFKMSKTLRVWKFLDTTIDIKQYDYNKDKRAWIYKKALYRPEYATHKEKDSAYRANVYFDSTVNRYYSRYTPEKKFLIDQVHLLVKEGLLLEIEASIGTADNGNPYTYRNKRTAIDLVHFENHGSTILSYVGIPYTHYGKDLFIYLDDVVSYFPVRSYSDVPNADFDITMTPDTAHNHYDLTESTSLNSYFNVAAFTDIKGLNGGANGLAQFQGEGKFITNTRTIGEGATVAFNYVAFEGGLAKFDSKSDGTMLFHKDSVSRRDLYQRSIYSIGLKVNVLRGFTSPRPAHLLSDWQLNFGYNFTGGKVVDTSFKDAARTVIDTTTRTVIQNDFYIEPIATVARHQNFALSASLPLHWISMKSDDKIKNTGMEHWIAPTIELMYYAKKDRNSKLFFRYRYLSNLDHTTQSFTQIQFGYSINLSSVWSPTPAN